MPKLKKEVAIYLAGLIDGEGCFYISKKSVPEYYQPQFKIVLVDEPTIAWVAERLNRPYTHQLSKVGKNHKDTYTIRISDRAAVLAFIPQILPYMILKRAVASNMLEFCEMREIYQKTDKTKELSMYLKNKQLNRVGIL